MNNSFLRKVSFIVGICIISLSVLMFFTYLVSYFLSVAEYNANSGRYYEFSNVVNGILMPISYLISGFGFGGVIILLGRLIKSDTVEAKANPENNAEVSDNN